MTDGSGNSEGGGSGRSSTLKTMQANLESYLKPLRGTGKEAEPEIPPLVGIYALNKASHEHPMDRRSLFQQQADNERALAAARKAVAKAAPKTTAVGATQRRPAP